MANPLTLYVPIKQDEKSQATAQAIYANFVEGVQKGLDGSNIVHYARVTLIPNASGGGTNAIMLITTFDGPMNPYLDFFWNNEGTKLAFATIAAIALNPPNPPVTNPNGFQNFINSNNLNEGASPGSVGDLYEAYPQTVKEIKHVSAK
jgi:hypothetical protein